MNSYLRLLTYREILDRGPLRSCTAALIVLGVLILDLIMRDQNQRLECRYTKHCPLGH